MVFCAGPRDEERVRLMRPMNPRVKELQTVEVPCAFCGGKGRDAFGVMSWLSTCYVCFGMKEVSVVDQYKECRYCKETVIKPKNVRVSCIVCKGYGVVHVPLQYLPSLNGSTTET